MLGGVQNASRCSGKPRLNILGAGRLGRAVGRLWTRTDLVEMGAVCNRSLNTARQAVAFIGGGEAVATVGQFRPGQLTLIATPDNAIDEAVRKLRDSAVVQEGSIVFHASGSLSSALLEPLRAQGAWVASVHPIRAFADPAGAVMAFNPTFCGSEGDEAALQVLEPLFARVGGECLRIDPRRKTLYHAAAVIASNYLVALVDLSLEAYAQAGISRDDARRLLSPILAGTLANIERYDTTAALTGPVSRGDADTVADHLGALSGWCGDAADVYRALGHRALMLARKQGFADEATLERIATLFNTPPAE